MNLRVQLVSALFIFFLRKKNSCLALVSHRGCENATCWTMSQIPGGNVKTWVKKWKLKNTGYQYASLPLESQFGRITTQLCPVSRAVSLFKLGLFCFHSLMPNLGIITLFTSDFYLYSNLMQMGLCTKNNHHTFCQNYAHSWIRMCALIISAHTALWGVVCKGTRYCVTAFLRAAKRQLVCCDTQWIKFMWQRHKMAFNILRERSDLLCHSIIV